MIYRLMIVCVVIFAASPVYAGDTLPRLQQQNGATFLSLAPYRDGGRPMVRQRPPARSLTIPTVSAKPVEKAETETPLNVKEEKQLLLSIFVQ